MKKLFFTLCAFGMGILTSCSQLRMKSSSCPISSKTTKITYSQYTNSGEAISTTTTILEDCLIWEYHEIRNNCHLKDSCRFERAAFEELIKDLSTIHFSAKDAHDYSSGGAGYGLSFEANADRYFSYNSSYKLSGDYDHVTSLIQQFIESHKTECELLFERLAKEPHEQGDFGEFMILPEELEKYRVK